MRARNESGFTLPLVLGVLTVGTLLAIAAFATARSGTFSSGQSRDEKQAYAAAEAGVNWYLSRLIFDNAFWAKCTSVAGPAAPVNNPWDGTGSDPRLFRTIPGTASSTGSASGDAKYAVELLPANGATACVQSNSTATMISSGQGTFRIRATGVFNGQKRSLIATFRRAKFTDFLYLTNYETTDPDNYPSADDRTYAAANCKATRATRPDRCTDIQFAAGDEINGPLHSDDSLQICGGAKFGRTASDQVETASAAPGFVQPSGCGAPNFVAALKTGANLYPIPKSDDELPANVLPGYRLTGTVYLTLRSATGKIEVRTTRGASAFTTLDWPVNGLIYVDNGTSGCNVSTLQPPAATTYPTTANTTGCANVFVNGGYKKDLTIYSENDVVVDGNLTQDGGDAVAGLIAKRFVRIYHPVSSLATSTGSCSGNNSTGSLQNPTIQAAILALNHSFTVDNYRCGGPLGDLTVTGAIAQPFRGAVGTGSGTTMSSGYSKSYGYDDRLAYRNPPFFTDPDDSTWRVLRLNEQVPAQ